MAGFGEVEADSAFGRRKMIPSESGLAEKRFPIADICRQQLVYVEQFLCFMEDIYW